MNKILAIIICFAWYFVAILKIMISHKFML
jgi:hypothetical protein